MHQPHAIFNLRRFLSTSALYAAGDLLTKCARVILVPYYIHALTNAELGTLGVLQAVATACWYLSALGLGYAVRRYYFDYGADGDRFVATVWWVRMLVMALPCALLVAISYATSPTTMPQISPHLLALAIGAGFLRGGFIVIESWFVIREQPLRYRTFTFFQFFTTTALIIYLVSARGMGVTGAIVGELIAHAIWTVFSVFAFGAAKPTRRLVQWPPLFQYCLPIIPYTMFMWALAWVDRIILQHYVSLSELGLYDAGYMLASTLSILALAMRAAWLPDYFRNASHPDAPAKYARVATYYFAVMAFATGAAVAFAPEGIWLVARSDFQSAIGVVRIVMLGLGFYSLFVAFYQPLTYAGHTISIAVVSGAALLVNVVANIALIPFYGIFGAAVATLLSYVVLSAMTYVITRQRYNIPWEWKTILACAAGATLLGLFGCWLDRMPPLAAAGAKGIATLVLFGWLALLLKGLCGTTTESEASAAIAASEDIETRGVETRGVAHES